MRITTTEAFELKTYGFINGDFERISELTGWSQNKLGAALGIGHGNVPHYKNQKCSLDFRPSDGLLRLIRPERKLKEGSLGKSFNLEGARQWVGSDD
jgi:hypothetical protein